MAEPKPEPKKKGRPRKTVPGVKLKDEAVSLSVKSTLTRSAGCLQKLLQWSESTLEQVADGKTEVLNTMI